MGVDGIAVGLLIGLAIGMTGIGGGTITAPVLVLLIGYAPRRAVATALVFAAATNSLSTTSKIGRSGARFDFR